MSNTLRASVTAAAGGTNLCPNGALKQDTLGYTVSASGGPDTPTINVLTPADQTLLGLTNPVGADASVVQLTYTGPNTGAILPAAMFVPNTISATQTVTYSCYAYVPAGNPGATLIADAHIGDSTTVYDQWERLSLTFTASVDGPVVAIWPHTDQLAGEFMYLTGFLIQEGTDVGVYTDGGGQPGDPVQVLVDGSDTPVTANGLPEYLASPGDRLLVQKVGGMLEVVQFLSRGTVPYITGDDLTPINASLDQNASDIASNAGLAASLNDTVTNYIAANDVALTSLQDGYDVLHGIGAAGVEEDYIWVGDDPSLSTVKSVQISTFVQSVLASGDYTALSTACHLWDKDDIGDLTFASDDPPMTTFYNYFTANGRSALPWN